MERGESPLAIFARMEPLLLPRLLMTLKPTPSSGPSPSAPITLVAVRIGLLPSAMARLQCVHSHLSCALAHRPLTWDHPSPQPRQRSTRISPSLTSAPCVPSRAPASPSCPRTTARPLRSPTTTVGPRQCIRGPLPARASASTSGDATGTVTFPTYPVSPRSPAP